MLSGNGVLKNNTAPLIDRKIVLLGLMLAFVLFQSNRTEASLLLAAITGEEAVLVAEQHSGKGKVLGTMQEMKEDGRIVYRVKILMPSGVLRTVVIDAETGGVLE